MIADIFEAISSSPILADVECAIGAENVDVNSAPPRMVWIPVSDEWDIVQGLRGVGSQRAFAMRKSRVRIRFWGKAVSSDETVDDIRAAEALMSRAVVAIFECARGSVQIVGTEWVDADGQEVTQYGRAVDLTVVFDIPVVREECVPTEAWVRITSLPADSMTGTMDFPPSGESLNDVTGTPAP